MDALRTLETRLAWLTLVALAVFAPVETFASWQMLGGARGLIHPAYLVTFTGIVLMLVGALHSLRARPQPSPAPLCVSHAWIVGYGLRSAFWRIDAVGKGIDLHFGQVELWATVGGAAVGVAAFAMTLVLTLRAAPARVESISARTLETRLAIFSLLILCLLAPIETAASWQLGGGLAGLVHPYFVHKVAGMVLLVVGARHSLAARPLSAPGVMCAAHAWWAATGWGATVGRYVAVSEGAELHWGSLEFWFVGACFFVALTAFVGSFYLTWRASACDAPHPFRLIAF